MMRVWIYTWLCVCVYPSTNACLCCFWGEMADVCWVPREIRAHAEREWGGGQQINAEKGRGGGIRIRDRKKGGGVKRRRQWEGKGKRKAEFQGVKCWRQPALWQLTDAECGLVSGLQSKPYKQSDHSLCLNSAALLPAIGHTHTHCIRTNTSSHTCTCTRIAVTTER